MPDLTLITTWQCESIHGPRTMDVGGYTQRGLFHERTWPTCSCPAYKYAKRTVNFGGRMVAPACKHIREAQQSVCGWHEQFSAEAMQVEGTCPKCKGPAHSVQFAT